MSYEWPKQKGRIVVVASVLILVSQCSRVHPQPANFIDVANTATASQLVAGFYDVEGGKWRWTARRFIVSLAPPRDADQKGAKLLLQFYLPDTQIQALGPMTLTADVDNRPLPSETYTKGGQYTYVQDVAPASLRSNLVPILFRFDKAVPPSAADGRELAAIVSKVSLQATQ